MDRNLYDIMIREYERRLPLPRDTENAAVLEDLGKKIEAARKERKDLISEYYGEATTTRRKAAIRKIWRETYGVEFETEWISGLSVRVTFQPFRLACRPAHTLTRSHAHTAHGTEHCLRSAYSPCY
jgi:hypothetical protein